MHVIHQICLDYRETKDFSGAVLIRQGETTLYEGAFGLAHRGFNIANRPDTRFDTASVTKLFTAAAILRLVQEQRLHLEDRIADLIDLTGTRIPVEVTVFQLLTHTSGLGYSIIQKGPIQKAYDANGIVGGQASRLQIPGFAPVTPAPSASISRS